MNAGELPVMLPPSIQNGTYLETLLTVVIKLGADDLLLTSDSFCYLKLDKKMVQLSNRKVNALKVDLISKYINDGVDVDGIIGQGRQKDKVISLPLDDDGNPIPDSKRGSLLKPENTYRFRVNITGCEGLYRRSKTLTLRRIQASPPKLSEIGMTEDYADIFLKKKQGLTLVAGATGQGKSTTLAAMISYLASQPDAHENIVTAESPVEYVYFGVNKPSTDIKQMSIPEDIKSFSEAVRCMLRMALTTGLIGEMRDEDTIRMGTLLSQTGHRVFSTVHADDVAAIIPRCISFSGGVQHQLKVDLVNSLNSLLSQRLIVGVDGKKVAIRESLHLNEDGRKKIISAEASELKTTIQKLVEDYGVSFRSDAERLLGEGKISKTVFNNFCDGFR